MHNIIEPSAAVAAVTSAAAPRRPRLLRSAEEALEAAHALAAQFAPEAAERDRERRLPWPELDAYSASGLWAITVPEAYGGPGLSSVTLAQVIAIISAADGSLGQIPQNHYYALEVLRNGGSAEQQRLFYGLALEGQRFGNALAEIGHKDFQRRTRVFADRALGGYRVHGRKFYCTGALYAHWIPTLAATEDGNLLLVFIPREAPGVTVIDDWDGFGQRVTGSGSVVFDQVHVDGAWVVPFKASFDRPTAIGPHAQLMHAAIDHGIATGAIEAALPFLRQHARPWIDAGVERASDDTLTLERIGDLQVRLRASQALLHRAARLVDVAQQAPDADTVARASVAVAQARILSTEIALQAGTRLFELCGTGATLGEHGLDRYWRNARTHTLHDPVRWKFHAVGNYVLNHKLPPRHGAI